MWRTILALVMTGQLLMLAGCSTAPPKIVSAAATNEIETVRVVHIVPQRALYKEAFVSYGGGPLIDDTANAIKLHHEKSEAERFIKLISDIDVGEELHGSITRELDGLDWARVTEVEKVASDEFSWDEYIGSISEDALIVITTKGAISPYFEIVEFTAGISIYRPDSEKVRPIYANRVIHQSRIFSTYETIDKESVSKDIKSVKEAFKESFKQKDNDRDESQLSWGAERWLNDYALKLTHKAEKIDAGSSNEGGEKWLNDSALFSSLVSQGIKGVSELVRCELNHKGLDPDQEVVFIPLFHRVKPSFMSAAFLSPGYIVKQDEERQVVKLFRPGIRQAMISIEKGMPVLSPRDRKSI